MVHPMDAVRDLDENDRAKWGDTIRRFRQADPSSDSKIIRRNPQGFIKLTPISWILIRPADDRITPLLGILDWLELR